MTNHSGSDNIFESYKSLLSDSSTYMDFIGTKFNTPKGGILTVVGKLPKEPGRPIQYQLECSICSKDTELFPELFTSSKGGLVNGHQTPCGCSNYPKWTKEQYEILINRTIKDKYEFRGFADDWNGVYTKVKLYCHSCEYEWGTNGTRIVNDGRGCPCCAGLVRYSQETATTRIQEVVKDKYEFRGFVGLFKGNKTKVKLHCLFCAYDWEPFFNDVVTKGSGCPCCAGNAPITQETATTRIQEVVKDKYEFRGFVGGWKSTHKTKVRLYCSTCGYRWEPVFKQVVNNGRGCPCCADYGYQLSKPGKLYVIKYTTKSNQTFLKYGITNREVNKRSKEHTKTSETKGEILHVYEFEDGTIPLQIENEIHDLRDEVGYIETSKEEFPNGYTETLDVRYEKDVLDIIQKYVQYVPEYEERLCA